LLTARSGSTLFVNTFGLIPNQARILTTPSSASIPASAIKAHSEAAGIDAALMVLIVDVEELFAGFGSTSTAVTVAVLDTAPGGVDVVVSTRLIVALPPFANAPTAHDTVVVPLQDPCDGVAETNVVPAGSTSVTTTLLAAPGPLLTTLIV
jgi:hypothetical protein